MSTHALLGVKFPDGKILGCYVHFDGYTLDERLHEYFKTKTTTNLALLISEAQVSGGMRSFYQATGHKNDAKDCDLMKYKTDFLHGKGSNSPNVITEDNWEESTGPIVHFRYLVDYETSKFIKEQCF